MYSVSSYGKMITDGPRMAAYAAALKAAVHPGAVVLDIGTGTGIFALVACQYGARKVYAVEPADAIQVAREIAAANGLSDKIEFFQGLSTKWTLPEQVDVIISDLRGVLPLFQQHIPSIADARRRLLKPGGVLIPQRDTLWAAPVSDEKVCADYAGPWLENAYDLDMRAAYPIVINAWRKARVAPDQLIGAPQVLTVLDYTTIENPDIRCEVAWTASQAARAHGLAVWFDAVLAEGIGFSNAPEAPELIYGNAFFPWQEPADLAEGDRIEVTFQADLVGDDYVWRWNTRVFAPGEAARPKADFRQSTLLGVPLSPTTLRKRADRFVPQLSDEGRITHFILEAMAQNLPLGTIATQVAERFASHFPTWNAAMARVGELSEKYSQ